MENKPLHYDGSIQSNHQLENEESSNEAFEITEEMRKNISGNPYINTIE
ncbi:hypothetical protein [Bacillus litorisediminis]|nr:hypothetical protein [Bacillus litorisediminis]